MSKNNENKLVPKLRFPEFEGSGKWERNVLEQVAIFVNEKTPLETLSINSYISTENLLPDYAGVTFASKLPSFGNFTKYKKGDVLISNIRPYLKKVWFADKDGACSNDVIAIRANSVVSNSFLSSLLKNDAFISYIMKGAEGVKMPRGDKDSIKGYLVTFPKEKAEQQKIASCLSSLDEVITAESQKLIVLKEHKKGLLQNLFPQAGEKVPKLRFKEFEGSGEWLKKELGEICKMQAGKFVSASEIKENYSEHLFSCYGGNGLRGYTKSFTHVGRYSLIGRQGALCGNVTLADGTFHATEHAVVVTPEKYADKVWLYYMLGYLNLNQYATGQAQPGLSVTNLEKVELTIPKSIEEQHKIAETLSSIDGLINAQSQKVEALKLHKKGLLQGLFPQTSE